MARLVRPALTATLEAIGDVEIATRGKTFEDFAGDWLLRHGVQRGIEIAPHSSRSAREHRDDRDDCNQDDTGPLGLRLRARRRPEPLVQRASEARANSDMPRGSIRLRKALEMTSSRTFSLLAAATVLSGWLAGAALDRSAVGMPVWQALGPESWAHVSDRAVFGTGLTMDAVVGVAAMALTVAAAASGYFGRNSQRETPVSLILAIVFSFFGLLFTAKAAYLVQLLAASQPAADLQPIFNAYLVWGVDFRAAADAVAFVAVVWALSGLSVFAASRSLGDAEPPAVDDKAAAGGSALAASRTDR
jgi:hypothetical protein